MNTSTNQQQNHLEESEIDIMTIVVRLWNKRKFIFKVISIFAVLGLFVALFSPKEYTSSCVFIPQSAKKTSSSISSLAALAGINIGNMSTEETLSPIVYPKILDNIDFKKELMYSKIKFAGYEQPIALIDYYTNPDYAKFNLFKAVKKYTIELPGLIIGKIIGAFSTEEEKPKNSDSFDNVLKRYSKEEYQCAKVLGSRVLMTLDEKKGFITLVATMNEPLAAAQLCQTTFDLLQKYVTEFKQSKANDQRNFIKGRYDETKAKYEETQRALAQFIDANKVISTAQARTEQDRLTSEYNMANAIYSEMTKQLLQADIQVKEDTPILTAVQPVSVPYKKSKPQRAKILFVWCLLGGILGCGLIMGGDWLKEQGVENKWLDKIIK